MAITYFEAWFDKTVEDIDDAYCLYMAVTEKCDYGIFKISEGKSGQIFIFSTIADSMLMIASEAALKCFIKLLEDKWCKDGMPMEIYYSYVQAIRKDD